MRVNPEMSLDDIQHAAQTNVETPASAWERDSAKRAIDELFSLTHQYKSSKQYNELMTFVARFRFYSPYNAMLVHVQMPGATFVAPASRWRDRYKREIIPGARPIVILQPMGPVMFVFDVIETEPTEDAPRSCHRRSIIRSGQAVVRASAGSRGLSIMENVTVSALRARFKGLKAAGSIRRVDKGLGISQEFQSGLDSNRDPIMVDIPVKFDLLVNSKHTREEQYATIAHELAHLYCGHLGSPNPQWWPSRVGLCTDVAEFEAESVAYMVCRRLGIDGRSAEYLAGYFGAYVEVPRMSLELVMKAAGLIEKMTVSRLKPRK